jgi:hypothetical protein
VKGLGVLNEMVVREVVGTWPELAPERIGKVDEA